MCGRATHESLVMKRIALSLAILLVGLSALWLAADTLYPADGNFFALRNSQVNYTGIITIGAMSVGMVLAVRPAALESLFGGLDKMYRLHKWLGVTALVGSLLHWLWSDAPKWMVGWGWLVKPARGPHVDQTMGLESVFHSQRGVAGSVGEWAFYTAVLLIVVALIKQFPYRHFFRLHRLLAVVYLLLVFHAVLLMKFSYWNEPVGATMAVLMLAGSAAAFGSLLRQVGFRHRAPGVIAALVPHPDNRVLRVTIRLKGRWAGHKAGQFAFVTFDHSEGPHPFTISSGWNGDGTMDFLIKGVGDYTDSLPASLRVGDVVKVEGPYGRFNFTGSKTRQIWVAGGIGITPFMARMETLSVAPDGKIVDLFYCTNVPDEGFIANVHRHAEAAAVRLHVLVAQKDGKLSGERARAMVPDWLAADIWFFGPTGFGHALRRNFAAQGMQNDDFHQELFDMR
jgi:predicted ferric reductase